MNKKIILMILISLVALTPMAHATDGEGINLSTFPQALADYFGVSLLAGQILATSIFLALFIFPLLVFTKGKNIMLTVIVSFLVMGTCLAFGWLPYWIFILTAVTVGLLFGGSIRDMISGKGGG
jgi:hypothetical protein